MLNTNSSKTLVLLLLMALGVHFPAQSQEDPKDHAKALVKLANEIYAFGSKLDALELYVSALKEDSTNVEGNFMAGICYLETNSKYKGLPYLMKAYELDFKFHRKTLFYIAECHHFSNQFEDAIVYYKHYRNKTKKDFAKKKIKEDEYNSINAGIKRRIEECHHGIHMIKHPVNIEIMDIGDNVNSRFPDYTPAITADEKTMIFTSRRQGSTGDLLHSDHLHYEDIYISHMQDNGHWSKAENIGVDINTIQHDAVVSVSPDGKHLFIYKDNGGGDLYESRMSEGGKWSKPTPIKAVNSKSFEGHITESKDGDYFIFSSNRKGGHGGLDLYMITKDKKGKWGKPVNLGKPINTKHDEESPFLDLNGNLYFSSRGHKSMGGYDIVQATHDKVKNHWSHPHNLGFPINSADDDLYFVLPGKGERGYFSSYKEPSYGGKDIYMINMPRRDEKVEKVESRPITQIHDHDAIKPSSMGEHGENGIRISGAITSDESGEFAELNVEVTDVANGKTVSKAKSSATDGTYEIFVPKNGEYIVSTHGKGYLYQSQKVSTIEKENQKPITMNFKAPKAKVGAKIVIENVYFDPDRASLRRDSYAALNSFLEAIWDLPKCKIEISGHTDNMGSDTHNKRLSLWRADAVVEYLLTHGVDVHELVPKGYGFTKPIASNKTAAGREKNRRIEMKIISGL